MVSGNRHNVYYISSGLQRAKKYIFLEFWKTFFKFVKQAYKAHKDIIFSFHEETSRI